MKSFRIKKNEVRRRIYLAGGVKSPFRKPELPLRVFFRVHKPNEYKTAPISVDRRATDFR